MTGGPEFFELDVPGYEELVVAVRPEDAAEWAALKRWCRDSFDDYSVRPCGPVPLPKAFTPAEARESLVGQGG